MFGFKDMDRIPTRRELEKRYNCKMDVFPFGEQYDCCVKDPYPSDFISHRMGYHKISLRQTIEELDEFMAEIFERHTKQNQELR